MGDGPLVTDHLIVGLGNPGPKYAASRHNVGASAIAHLAKRYGVRMVSSSLAQSGLVEMDGVRTLLVRPRTWYNGSGRAVQHLLDREGLTTQQLLVMYDEVELPEGRVDLRKCTDDGGNNGLKSIIETTGKKDFGLIRIGVGGALGIPRYARDPNLVLLHVLATPWPEARQFLDEAVERASELAISVARDGWAKASTSLRSV